MKIDCQPLLAPGRHSIKLEEAKSLFVDPFNCTKRYEIYMAFYQLAGELITRGIPCQLWLDGSFVTDKHQPEDLDMSVQIDADVVDALSPENSSFIFSKIANPESKYLGVLDAYVHVNYPLGYTNDSEKAGEASTWAEEWMLGHQKDWLKGIAVVRILETNVGLRLCS